MSATDRSISRGREANGFGNGRGTSVSRDRTTLDSPRGRDALPIDKISTGRGGAGNIIRSPSRDIEPESRGHVLSERLAAKADIVSTGRGGAGNVRSTSQSRERKPLPDSANQAEYEREVLRRAAEARAEVTSSGRGGIGNISGSRSRSRSKGPGPALHSSGRGGAGNIEHGLGNAEQAEILDDAERAKHAHPNGIHSTGRGGVANVNLGPGPGVEHVEHQEGLITSSGRGGAGNIRDRSTSREPGSRNASKERHPISGLLHKLHPHQHVADPNAIKEDGAE